MIIVPMVELSIPDDVIYTNVPADVIPPEFPEDETRYQMFAPISNGLTQSNTNIIVEIKPTSEWDTIMLFNVSADTITATVLGGPTWTETVDIRYTNSYLLNRPNVILFPPLVRPSEYPDAKLRVNIQVLSSRLTVCELLAVGKRERIGTTCYGTSIGITDYSRKERDEFGNVIIIERGYSDTVSFKFELDTNTVEYARNLLASLRAKPTGYLGDINVPATYIFGLYKDFTIPVEAFSVSTAELVVDSVVRTGVVDTDGPTALQAFFVDPDAYMTCLGELETQGVFKRITLDENLTLAGQRFRVLVPIGREPLSGETLEWDVSWEYDPAFVQEHGTNVPTEFSGNEVVLQNNCGEWVAFYLWPHIGYIDQPLPESACSIVLRFTDLEGTVHVSNAVTVILDAANQDQDECTPENVDVFWYNATTEAFDIKAAYGCVGLQDMRDEAASFDAAYYLATYPDVAAAIASGDFESAHQHYFYFGDTENRKPNAWFEPAYYKAQNPDVVAQLFPNDPFYFYNTLEHYSGYGKGEGRLPCSTATLSTAPVLPIGEFYWIGRVGTDYCSGGKCSVTWEWTFTGANPPKVQAAKNLVVVCAEVVESETELVPVSPGVLTLTATVQCPAESEDSPTPDPIVLEPITLTLLQFSSGWVVGGSIEFAVATDDLESWTAKVTGDLTECSVTWDVTWQGDQSDAPSVDTSVPGFMTVDAPGSAGVVVAQATVTGLHGCSVTLDKIYLNYGNYSYVPPVQTYQDPIWLDGTTETTGYVKSV